MPTIKQDVEGVLTDVKGYVEDKLALLTGPSGLIEQTRQDLESFLTQLKNAMSNYRVPAPEITLDGDLNTIQIDVKPDLGDALDTVTAGLDGLQDSIAGTDIPVKPSLDTPGTFPDFDDSSEAPVADVISLPTLAPGATLTVPDNPTVDSTVDFPDLPAVTVPTAPTLPQLTIPADISVNPIDVNDYVTVDFTELQDKIDDTFSKLFPIIDDILNRMASLQVDDVWDSEEYQLIITALRTNTSTGGSGLSDEVFNNELQREVQLRDDTIREALKKGAGVGWQLPGGFLLAQVTAIEKDWMDKRMAAFNELSKIELPVRHQTMNTALDLRVKLEGMVMDYKTKILGLVAEMDKAIAQIVSGLADTQIKMLSAYTSVLDGQVKQFEAAIKNEMAKVEVFKAQVEAEKAQAELGAAQVELYKGQIEGENTKIKLYAAQVDAQKSKVDLERLKVEMFRAQIDAYVAQLNARTAEIQAYEAELKGELSKVELYKSQTEVYKTQVETATIRFNALVEEQRQILEMNKLKIQSYAGEVDAYKSIIQAYGEQADVYTKMAQVQLSAVQSQTELAKVEGQLQIQAHELDFEKEKVRLNLEEKSQEAIIREVTLRLQAFLDFNKETIHSLNSLLSAVIGSIGVNAQLQAGADARESYDYNVSTWEGTYNTHNINENQ